MLTRILCLLLLIGTGPSLLAPVSACCPRDGDCCTHEAAGLPAPPDDCCSLATLNDYLAVSAPGVPSVAAAPAPALPAVAGCFQAPGTIAALSSPAAPPPRLLRFTALRN